MTATGFISYSCALAIRDELPLIRVFSGPDSMQGFDACYELELDWAGVCWDADFRYGNRLSVNVG
jgi:hypothetical protein